MTDFRNSQTVAEAWVIVSSDRLVVSQTLAEVWLRQIPTTACVISQALAEVWVPSPVAAPPVTRRYQEMSQAM